MPVSADQERRLLNHYGISTIYPEAWPGQEEAEFGDEDEDEEGEDNDTIPAAATVRPVSEQVSPNAVHKDEPDALGFVPSVASELRRRGLAVEDDLRLCNRFMLSSTSFSPALYLAQVHRDDSSEELLRGLDFLSRSIAQKSASLKVLVESNFERFVKAKTTIDHVYTEMRNQGAPDASTTTTPQLGGGSHVGNRRSHIRHTSKTHSHFRNMSGAGVFAAGAPNGVADKRKNALTKESEYGVLGIRAPLQEIIIQSGDVWGQVLGGKERGETAAQALGALEQYREIFRLPSDVSEAVKAKNYEGVARLWKSAQSYAARAQSISENAKAGGNTLTDSEVQEILVTAKMWHDVSAQINAFKRHIRQQLKHSHGKKSAALSDEAHREEYMELISALLMLADDENPIWEWLHSRYCFLKERIEQILEQTRVEMEVLRRSLAMDNRPDPSSLARYLSKNSQTRSMNLGRDADAPAVIKFWEKLDAALQSMFSTRDGLLGEVKDFWELASSFIDGRAQKSFLASNFASDSEHLTLNAGDADKLKMGTLELVHQLRNGIHKIFCEKPAEDLKDLYGPGEPNANGRLKRTLTLHAENPSLKSPKKGEQWEAFAFWPPYSNALSGSHYLAKTLTLIGTGAGNLSGLSVVQNTPESAESLRSLVATVRERCVAALIIAWTADAGERCRGLEMWQRSPNRRDVTTMPDAFMKYQENVLANAQKLAYVSDASANASYNVIVPPSTKVLQGIRSCFVTSLYKTLGGMVENAENAASTDYSQNIRALVVLSNLAYLRSDIIPKLISVFESSFSVKLTDENKTIRDVLSQIESREFQAYAKPISERLAAIIIQGVHSPTWTPREDLKPSDVRPYVYDVLLGLVLVHSEVSTTAPGLTQMIISHLLEQVSTALLTAFNTRQPPGLTLSSLMQATLDVEFIAQTLNNFNNERVTEIQGQIYICLDERTPADARRRLQGELPEMKGVLKRLRESTKGEFGCFRRERKSRQAPAK
ncbi:exocyst complex protein [Piedraia hortae CBS 480.64]|uniref:Exocyst complex component SEC5 n=1 Tax=Piedraia hortae CBS 480.64 TaxID=1314780 RepID=A0A6A7BZ41_9PEZI|nr:exocyst complex protein [Piedraia hortae CBS 480.64]